MTYKTRGKSSHVGWDVSWHIYVPILTVPVFRCDEEVRGNVVPSGEEGTKCPWHWPMLTLINSIQNIINIFSLIIPFDNTWSGNNTPKQKYRNTIVKTFIVIGNYYVWVVNPVFFVNNSRFQFVAILNK